MKFDLEVARRTLNALSLTSNIFGDYMVVMESEISVILSGEPYVAFMLLLDVKTGNYFARIWNQTVESGKVGSGKELFEACDAFFWRGRPCLGCPVTDSDDYTSDEFIISQTPIKRKYSMVCQKVLAIVEATDVRACSECLKLMDVKCDTVTENYEGGKDIFRCDNGIQPTIEDVKTDILLTEDKPILQTKTEQEFSAELEDQEDYMEEGVHPQDIFTPEESFHAQDKSVLKYRHKKGGKYPQIITEALLQAKDNMLCLKDIFRYIEDKHPHFGHDAPGWQNSVRHTLSVNRNFQNIPAPNDEVERGRKKRVWTFTSTKGPVIADDDGVDENRDDFKDILEGVDGPELLQPDQPTIYNKPPLSYSQLIMEAARIGTERSRVLSFNEVCRLISRKHPYYDMEVKDWQLNVEKLYNSKFKLDFIKMVNKRWETNLSQKRPKVDNKKKIKRSKEKPPYTFAEMISQAFEHSESKILSRKDIYTYIQKTYPYYTHSMKHWKAAAIEELTKSSTIKKIGRTGNGTNTFSLWKLIDGTEVQCPKCHTFFQCKDDEYFTHMRNKHFYGNFTCPSGCDVKAEYAKELTDHMEQEEHHEGLLVQCPLCEEYTQAKELEPHYVTCVSAKMRKPANKQICPTCGKQIGVKRFDAHMKSHLAQEDTAEEKKGSEPIVYHYCEQCGKRYEHKHNLTSHIKAHHEGVLYQCPLCPKTFKDRTSRWQHKNLVHSTDERYNCKYCRLRFGSESELRRHLPTHEVESQYVCRHCGKKMAFKKSLLQHEMIHTGEKPFECVEENCGKRWRCKSGLARHMRQVHGKAPAFQRKRRTPGGAHSHVNTTQLRHLL